MEDNKTQEIIQEPTELTAGEMLRNARTTGRRKREIPTIAKQLCIREEFLQALEDGNYTFIPELVYILGFARNYAMELGLNPDEIVNKIKREMGVIPDCHNSSSDNDVNSCDLGTKAIKSEKSANKTAKPREKIDIVSMLKRAWAFVCRNWYWFVEGAGLLIAALVVAVILMSGGKSDNNAVGDAPVAAEEVNKEPGYRVSVRERWGIENRKNANIILQAVRGSWIKIEDARGKTEFSRVLVEGDVYYLPVKGKYTATFGDAGGIDVWVNGQLAPKVGDDHIRKAAIQLDADKLLGKSKSDSKSTEKSDKSDKDNANTDSASNAE